MDFSGLSIIFFTSIIGGSLGTLVEGTSLITIPALIFLGLPPHTAIGTDRLGIAGLTTVGWYKFHQKGLINYSISETHLPHGDYDGGSDVFGLRDWVVHRRSLFRPYWKRLDQKIVYSHRPDHGRQIVDPVIRKIGFKGIKDSTGKNSLLCFVLTGGGGIIRI